MTVPGNGPVREDVASTLGEAVTQVPNYQTAAAAAIPCEGH